MRVGLKIKVINHAFYQAMLRTGAKSVAQFSREHGFSMTSIHEYLNLRGFPKTEQLCKRLEKALGEPIHLLFPENLKDALNNKKICRHAFYMHGEMNLERLGDSVQHYAIADNAPTSIEMEDVKNAVTSMMSDLADNEKQVIDLVFGLTDGKERSLRQIAKKLHLSSTRIDQIKNKALRKLRSPLRTRKLESHKDFLGCTPFIEKGH